MESRHQRGSTDSHSHEIGPYLVLMSSENVRLGNRYAIGLLCPGWDGGALYGRAVGDGVPFSGLSVDAQFTADYTKGQVFDVNYYCRNLLPHQRLLAKF